MKVFSIIFIAGLAITTSPRVGAQPPYGSRPTAYAPVSGYAPAPSYPAGPQPIVYEEPPKDYAFGYNVQELDEYGNPNVHSRTEAREGPIIKGQYRVVLPDCTTQIVDYFVDELQQYHADVKYEGLPCPEPVVEKRPHPGYGRAPVPFVAPHPSALAYAPAPIETSAYAPDTSYAGRPFRT